MATILTAMVYKYHWQSLFLDYNYGQRSSKYGDFLFIMVIERYASTFYFKIKVKRLTNFYITEIYYEL